MYPHQIAFNVLPQVERFKDGDDYTTEERKMMAETRKILGRVGPRRSPPPACASRSTRATRSRSTSRRASPLARRSAASSSPGRPGCVVVDDPADGDLPAGDRRRRPRRRAGRPHPPRPVARALPEHLDRRRQPAQGRGHERGPARRAPARARAAAGRAASGARKAKRSSTPSRGASVAAGASTTTGSGRPRRARSRREEIPSLR